MKNTHFIYLAILVVSLTVLISCNSSEKNDWVQLFNGKDLTNWDIKIAGYPLNENYANTVRVQDGLLKISYENYDTFLGEFGHVFYNQPFSSYHLRAEYRFSGKQVKGGPSWAMFNNGIMFHSQSAESMELYQKFPVSIEAQLLGGNGRDERTNGNVCTPGTHVNMDGKQLIQHCITSKSKTCLANAWVTFELIVHSDSIIHHIVNGDTVLTYTKPVIGLHPWAKSNLTESIVKWEEVEGQSLKFGYIAIQAETAPIEFRKIELKELD